MGSIRTVSQLPVNIIASKIKRKGHYPLKFMQVNNKSVVIRKKKSSSSQLKHVDSFCNICDRKPGYLLRCRLYFFSFTGVDNGKHLYFPSRDNGISLRFTFFCLLRVDWEQKFFNCKMQEILPFFVYSKEMGYALLKQEISTIENS